MSSCPNCGTAVAKTADSCQHCDVSLERTGEDGDDPSRERGIENVTRRAHIAGVIFVLLGGLLVLVREWTSDDRERVVEAYANALDKGDFEAAEALVHPDSPLSGETDDGYEDAAFFWGVAGRLDVGIERTEIVGERTEPNMGSFRRIAEVEIEASVSGQIMGELIDETQSDFVLVVLDDSEEWLIWDVGTNLMAD